MTYFSPSYLISLWTLLLFCSLLKCQSSQVLSLPILLFSCCVLFLQKDTLGKHLIELQAQTEIGISHLTWVQQPGFIIFLSFLPWICCCSSLFSFFFLHHFKLPFLPYHLHPICHQKMPILPARMSWILNPSPLHSLCIYLGSGPLCL